MQNAVVAVAAFQVQVELSLIGGRGGELHSPFDQLLNGGRTALGQNVHGFLFAKAGTCFQRVVDMEFELVCFFGDGCDTALCVVR